MSHLRLMLVLTLCHPLSLAHKQMPKQDLCSLCKLVVSFLEPYVDSNSTEVRYLHVYTMQYGICEGLGTRVRVRYLIHQG